MRLGASLLAWVACAGCARPAPPPRVRLIDLLPDAVELPSPPRPIPLASLHDPPSAGEHPFAVAFPVEPQRAFVLRARLRKAASGQPALQLFALSPVELARFGTTPRPLDAPVGRALGPCEAMSTGADGTVVCQRFDHLSPEGGAVLAAYEHVQGAGSEISLWRAAKADSRVEEHPLLNRLVRRIGHLTASGISWRSALSADDGRYVFDVELPAMPQLWVGLGHEQGTAGGPSRFVVRQDGSVVLDETIAPDDRWHDRRVLLAPTSRGRTRIELEAQGGSGAVWSNPLLLPERSSLPNVVLVTLDAVRPDHLSLSGYGRDTSPVLDRLAQSGVFFETATAQAGRTWESVTSLLTGLYPANARVRVSGVPLPADIPTLPERLSRLGYQTFAGTDLGQFPAIYESFFDEAEIVPTARKASPRAQAERLPLERGGQFAWFHLEHAHYPLTPTDPSRYDPSYQGRFAREFTRADHAAFPFPDQLTLAERAHLVALYDASIRDADKEVWGLLQVLEARGVLENTLLIVAADHGEQLGEHGAVLEHIAPYDAVLHVPLLWVWGNRLSAPRRIRANVQLVDVAPTVLSLLHAPGVDSLDGRDLSPALLGGGLADAPAFSELMGRVFSVRLGSQHLLVPDGPFHATFHDGWHIDFAVEQLYDLATDPGEIHDLAPRADPKTAGLEALLRAKRATWEGGADAEAPLPQAAFEALQQAGYVSHAGAAVELAHGSDAGVRPASE